MANTKAKGTKKSQRQRIWLDVDDATYAELEALAKSESRPIANYVYHHAVKPFLETLHNGGSK